MWVLSQGIGLRPQPWAKVCRPVGPVLLGLLTRRRGRGLRRAPSTARADRCLAALGVLFVAVQDAVPVTVDADAHPRTRRGAGVGQLAAFLRGELPQAGIGDRRVCAPIADEPA